jgi:hypothetical protein
MTAPPTSRVRKRLLARFGLAAIAVLAAIVAITALPGATAQEAGDIETASLPNSFAWESTGSLVSVQQTRPGRTLTSIKDPTVVNVDGQWHVYATTADTAGGWSMTYFGGFEDWSQAGSAQQYHLSQTAIGGGYRAAPQLFHFAPRDEWYLVYQTGLPSYSLLSHPGQPQSATAARNFMSSHPPIVSQNAGPAGYVVDYWVICDDSMCYLFFHNDNGYFFRAETTIGEFPNGFRNTVIVMSDPNKYRLFEAANVYKVGDTGQYLLIIEAIGGDGKRYFRSWTADSLRAVGDQWRPLADTESNAFMRANNVSFAPGVSAWTRDFSHGELLRASNDQTLTIDPCNMRFLYQGMDPNASGDYVQLPWRLGIVTQTNSPSDCDGGPGGPTESPTEGPTSSAPSGCTAAITVANDWGSGWQGNVAVTAGSAAIDGWTLTWTWPGGQQVTSHWNANLTQSGSAVTASDVGWNGRVNAGQRVEAFGFIANGPGAAPTLTCAER